MGTTVPNGDRQVVSLASSDAFRCARHLQRHPPGTESGVVEVPDDVVVVVVVDDVEEGSVDDDGGSVDDDVVEEGSVDDVDVAGAMVVEVVVVDVVDVVDVDDVEVVDEDVVVRGPVATSLTGGESPPRADSMLGSSPSIPSAQLPVPPRPLDAANWAAS